MGADTVARAAVIASDSIEQARMEAGDLINAHEQETVDWRQVVELSSIVAGKTPGRGSDADVTLFESQGLAMEDLVAAAHVYKTVVA